MRTDIGTRDRYKICEKIWFDFQLPKYSRKQFRLANFLNRSLFDFSHTFGMHTVHIGTGTAYAYRTHTVHIRLVAGNSQFLECLENVVPI
jgi:hypothetical protein